MAEASFRPSGYCPRCGYAMDPGVCPECGSDIPPEKLARIPPQLRRRRLIRVGLALCLFGAAGYGAYRFYRDVNWYRWLPNGVLVWLDQSEDPRAIREIKLRLATGDFSAAEVDALLQDAYSPELVLPKRALKDMTFPAVLRLRQHGFARPNPANRENWCVRLYEWQVVCDGREILEGGLTGPVYPASDAELDFSLPAAPAGRHSYRIKGRFGYEESRLPGTPQSYSWQFDAEATLDVEDVRLADAIRLRWSDELARAMAQCVGADLFERWGEVDLIISVPNPPIPVAFELWTRYPGEAGFTVRSTMAIVVGTGVNWEYQFRLDRDLAEKAIDIQIRPKPAEGIPPGFRECFGGVIEWRDVKVRSGQQTFRDSKPLAPTRVFRADETP